MILRLFGFEGTVAGIKINELLNSDSPIKFCDDTFTSRLTPYSILMNVYERTSALQDPSYTTSKALLVDETFAYNL